MAAKSLGELYVQLSARTAGFAQQLATAGESVEKLGKKIKGVANDLGGLALGFAGAFAGLVAVAAGSSAQVGAEVTKVKNTFTVLAVEISTALLPTIQALNSFLGGLVRAWRSLDDGTRSYLVSAVQVAAVVGGSLMVFGKLSGLVGAAAEGFSILAMGVAKGLPHLTNLGGAFTLVRTAAMSAIPSIVGVVTAMLPVIAVIGVVVLAAGALYGAWQANLGGIQARTREAWEWLVGATEKTVNAVLAMWDAFKVGVAAKFETVAMLAGKFVDAFWVAFEWLQKRLIRWVQDNAKTISTLFEAVGVDTQPMLTKLAFGLQALDTFASRETVSTALNLGTQFAVSVGEGIFSAGDFALRGTRIMFDDIGDFIGRKAGEIRGMVEGLFGGGGIAIPVVEVSTVGGRGAPNAGMSDNLRDIASGKGSAAFQAFRRSVERFGEDARRAVEDARRSLVDRALGSLGRLGDLISAAQTGAAAAGPEGAIAAVVGELLMQSATFQRIISTVNSIIQQVADALGQLLTPLLPLIGALSLFAQPLTELTSIIISSVVATLEPLIPTMVVLATLFQGLVPVIGALLQILMVIVNPLQLLAGPVLGALFSVLRTVGIIVLTIVKAIADAWNGIIDGVQWILRELGDIPIIGGALKDLANSLTRFEIETQGMSDSLHTLTNMTMESAAAQAEAAEAAHANAEANRRATESLSNVPSGWRRALRTAQAQDRQNGPTMPPAAPSAPAGGGGAPVVGSEGGRPTVTIGGQTFYLDPKDLTSTAPLTNAVGGFLGGAANPLATGPFGGVNQQTGNVTIGGKNFSMGGQKSGAGAANVVFNITGYDTQEVMKEAHRHLLRILSGDDGREAGNVVGGGLPKFSMQGGV